MLFLNRKFQNGKPKDMKIQNMKGAYMMKNLDNWKLFEKTGSVSAYLSYACASEEKQLENRKTGGQTIEYGDRDGNGTVSHARWRL